MKVKVVSAVCSLLVVACAFAAAFVLPSGQAAFTAAHAGSLSAKVSASASSGGYLIKTYGGKVAVFTSGSGAPDQVFDVNVASLPQAEQTRLKNGFRVQTRDEMLAVIENYSS